MVAADNGTKEKLRRSYHRRCQHRSSRLWLCLCLVVVVGGMVLLLHVVLAGILTPPLLYHTHPPTTRTYRWGLNLRNLVWHGFITPAEFPADFAALTVVLLISLADRTARAMGGGGDTMGIRGGNGVGAEDGNGDGGGNGDGKEVGAACASPQHNLPGSGDGHCTLDDLSRGLPSSLDSLFIDVAAAEIGPRIDCAARATVAATTDTHSIAAASSGVASTAASTAAASTATASTAAAASTSAALSTAALPTPPPTAAAFAPATATAPATPTRASDAFHQIASSSLIPPGHVDLLARAFEHFLAGRDYWFTVLSVPVLEHVLRLRFAVVNARPRVTLAHIDEYFSTLDGFGQRDKHQVLLDPVLVKYSAGVGEKSDEGKDEGKKSGDEAGSGTTVRGGVEWNRLYADLGPNIMACLLDLFLLEQGPGLRGKLSHGVVVVAPTTAPPSLPVAFRTASSVRGKLPRRQKQQCQLLYLHGFGETTPERCHVYAALAQLSYTVTAPCYHPHGVVADTRILATLSSIEALIERDLGGCVGVVGYSVGGLLASLLAWRRPDLVKFLVLLAPAIDNTARNYDSFPESAWGMPKAYVDELRSLPNRPPLDISRVPAVIFHGSHDGDDGGSAMWRIREWAAATPGLELRELRGVGHSLFPWLRRKGLIELDECIQALDSRTDSADDCIHMLSSNAGPVDLGDSAASVGPVDCESKTAGELIEGDGDTRAVAMMRVSSMLNEGVDQRQPTTRHSHIAALLCGLICTVCHRFDDTLAENQLTVRCAQYFATYESRFHPHNILSRELSTVMTRTASLCDAVRLRTLRGPVDNGGGDVGVINSSPGKGDPVLLVDGGFGQSTCQVLVLSSVKIKTLVTLGELVAKWSLQLTGIVGDLGKQRPSVSVVSLGVDPVGGEGGRGEGQGVDGEGGGEGGGEDGGGGSSGITDDALYKDTSTIGAWMRTATCAIPYGPRGEGTGARVATITGGLACLTGIAVTLHHIVVGLLQRLVHLEGLVIEHRARTNHRKQLGQLVVAAPLVARVVAVCVAVVAYHVEEALQQPVASQRSPPSMPFIIRLAGEIASFATACGLDDAAPPQPHQGTGGRASVAAGGASSKAKVVRSVDQGLDKLLAFFASKKSRTYFATRAGSSQPWS